VFLAKQLADQVQLPVQFWAPDGSVLYTNSAFNKLFGLDPFCDWEQEGRHLTEDPQLVASGAAAQLQRALSGAAVELHSVAYQRIPSDASGDIEALQLFLALRPLVGEDGDLVCIACQVFDHSQSRDLEEKQMMRSQKMENLEVLASGVAHEFNNIFTGIKGLADLIRDGAEPSSEIYEFASAIQQNIARGAALIQQLSSFAREMPHSLRRRMLAGYIQEALPLMLIHVQKRISIETRLDSDGAVLLDSNRMDQALANVLHNAREAMAGQGRVLIKLARGDPSSPPEDHPRADRGWLMLEVADSGPGIPEHLRGRVLEPFFSTKERGKATGLGLSVTERIVASHEGVLEIGSSEELGGAAIRIYLPLVSNRG